MNEELRTLEIQNWIIRYRLPHGDGPHPVIWLLHGLTGDEDSMWIFASRLPDHYLLLAPRGLYPTPMGGYSWHARSESKVWPQLDDFRPTVRKLFSLMNKWPDSALLADFSSFRVAGFSQGGALTYSIAMLHPERVTALAGLATFLPEGADQYLQPSSLKDIPIFISHGINDHIIPVERARLTVQQLDRAGAKVHYCESHVGHKLSADCFIGMEYFFQ